MCTFPPMPLRQLRALLIPRPEAERAPRCWWEQEVLTFCSCHPLTKAGFDSHLLPWWVGWNNKRAEKYSGDFFPPDEWVKPSHPAIRGKQVGWGVHAGKAPEISLAAATRPWLGWLCCELTLDQSCLPTVVCNKGHIFASSEALLTPLLVLGCWFSILPVLVSWFVCSHTCATFSLNL